MNTFRADLHIHSRFSRATSTRLSIPHLTAWAMIKGLSVVGTGDFTHPAWREELERDLVRDEASGLYRPRTLPADADVAAEIPGFARPGGMAEEAAPLFLLQTEISSIYKRGGAVRKVHNLVFMPDLDSVDRLNRKLASVGNLASDGRPILGLDSERLLEMVLETNERGVLIPAHVWTPWFALFGSKSGFDDPDDCFGALSSHIFALETGLSSDPDMNRLWSRLDRYVLISNSDAHSGENLGREANLFHGAPSYDGIFTALRRAAGMAREAKADASDSAGAASCAYRGTLEFFPEEGKYHLDGHRACNVVLDPKESKRLGDICPVCGRPLTVGVLHRVLDLADRDAPVYAPDEARFASLIPLPELLGELLGVGPKSRKVRIRQAELTARFGSELDILHTVPEADLRAHWDALGEAVARMRAGHVARQAGYDGEYGVVRVFDERERADFVQGRIHAGSLLAPAAPPSRHVEAGETRLSPNEADGADRVDGTAPLRKRGRPATRPSLWDALLPAKEKTAEQPQPAAPPHNVMTNVVANPAAFPYSEAQQRAIDAGPHPVLVVAGPGAGKTRTLAGRVVRLLTASDPARRVPAERILAVTFTRRAAGELRERLAQSLSSAAVLPRADTLHAVALSQWTDAGTPPAVLTEEAARTIFAKANPDRPAADLRAAWDRLSLARERLEALDDVAGFPDLADMAARYTARKQANRLADYTDLLERWLRTLTAGNAAERTATDAPCPWTEILMDEIQDLSPLQVAVIRALLPPSGQGFFGIGDPDQAVYGFRGAHPDVRSALAEAWPDLETVTLRESHRSASGILDSASALLGAASACGRLLPTRTESAVLHEFSAPDAAREAAWVAEQAARLIGATSHTLLDARTARKTASGMPDAALASPCSPGDLAVLVRMKSLIPPLRAALERRGVPCAVPESAPFWEEPRAGLLLSLAGRRFGRPFGADPEQDLRSPEDLPESLWKQGPDALLARVENTPPFDPLFRESAAFTALARAYREQGSWEALLDWTSLRRELDLVRAEAEQVQIMTLHAAKGLEFRAVFLPAVEEGLLPFAGPDALARGRQHAAAREAGGHDPEGHDPAESVPIPDSDDERVAEERRLFYVGLTRAREAVFLSHAARRTLYGRELRLPASRFLTDVERFFRHSRLIRHTRTTAQQMSLL